MLVKVISIISLLQVSVYVTLTTWITFYIVDYFSLKLQEILYQLVRIMNNFTIYYAFNRSEFRGGG